MTPAAALIMYSGGKPRRRARKVKRARLPLGHAADYMIAIRRLNADFEAAVRRIVRPALEVASQQTRAVRPDATAARIDEDDGAAGVLAAGAGVLAIDAAIAEVRTMLTSGPLFEDAVVEGIASRLAVRVSGFQRNQFGRQMTRAIGVDIVQAEPWLADHLALFVRENVGLIKSIPAHRLGEVESVIRRGLRGDSRVQDIWREIEARFDVSASKARLIARDQTLKLNSELNELRAKAVGITSGTWSTSKDERVRPAKGRKGGDDHRSLEGVSFKLAGPGLVVNQRTGRRAKPGRDFQCRCVMIPEFDELLGGGKDG